VKWLVMMAALLLTACSSDSSDSDIYAPDTSAEANTIRFNADVWRMMEGTRAATFDNAAALQTEAHFTAAAYTHNTTTAYFSPVQIDWDGDSWEFSDGKHYWPASGALDFFAYMPASGSVPSYITSDPTYSVIDTDDDDDNPDTQEVSFTCSSLPVTPAGQSSLKEFIYALQPGRTKALDGASGVTLTFVHPFARIKLQLSSTQEPIHINSITLKNIKNNGTYTHSGKWSPSGDATNFMVTLNADLTANADLGTYLVIPQSWAGEIEVDATWKEWDETIDPDPNLTTTIPATWAPGYSYTYTFTITENDLKVNTAKYTEQW
jgi:hypothetical protein